MGLSNLIAGLEQEAERDRLAVIRQADADVRAIERSADEAVADITARTLADAEARRTADAARELADARRRGRARELEARHAQVARVLDRARALLPDAAASAAYLSVLPSDVHSTLSYLQGASARVRCHPALETPLRAVVGSHAHVELVADASVGPGFVAEATDGSVVVDSTLAARLTALAPRLVIPLSRRMDDGS